MTAMHLRVGTDCSGIEAPIQALKKLNIPFKHVFASEIDPYAKQSLKANYSPGILYTDMTKRDNSSLPDIDLYVCGFPCQPFSSNGKKHGFNDTRGTVLFSCIDVIKRKQPKYFVLENVREIMKKDIWDVIQKHLDELKKLGYTIKHKLLNTSDYGIPQNRPRVYIVGYKTGSFYFPTKIPLHTLHRYVDYADKVEHILESENRQAVVDKAKDSKHVYVDLTFSKSGVKAKANPLVCPCLTTCASKTWNCLMNRYANVKEHLMLQGFPTDFKVVVSKTQMIKQIGNSMSVNVLVEILKVLLGSDI